MLDNERELGVGEVHLVMPSQEWDEVYFGWGGWLADYLGLEEFHDILHSLGMAQMRAKLELHLHDARIVVKRNLSPKDLEKGLRGMYELEHRSAYLGALEVREAGLFLGDVKLTMGFLDYWLAACSRELWGEPGLTTGRAAELAELIVSSMREAERKSLETLRRTLGDEAADRLLKGGEITVRSSNGEEYVITDSGEVFRPTQGGRRRHVCVEVEGEGELPRYDRVLAKYLVIRDHPEQIETLHRRRGGRAGGLRPLEEEREMLQHEIERLHTRLTALGELERRRRAERG